MKKFKVELFTSVALISRLCKTLFKPFQVPFKFPELVGFSTGVVVFAQWLNLVNIFPELLLANLAQKQIKTLGSILKRHKNKFSSDQSTEVEYKVECKCSKKVYIGQTLHALKQERKSCHLLRVIRTLCWHNTAQNSPEFDLDDAQIVDHCSQWLQYIFLEHGI